jgi:hypothetical protein
VDYFANKLEEYHGSWVAVLQYYLFGAPKPLLTGLIGGYAHPFILLADAVELGSPVLAMDSLALTCVDYGPLSHILDTLVDSKSPGGSTAPLDVLLAMSGDARFDGAITVPGIQNLLVLLQNPVIAKALLSYAALPLLSSDPDTALSELVETAVYMLLTTHRLGEPAFDFYLCHNLTFCNCLRILLPVITIPEHKMVLLRMHWLLTVLAFSTQGRPHVKPELLDASDATLQWDEIRQLCVGDGTEDVEREYNEHFVKAVNIMDKFAQAWPGREEFFRTAVNKLAKDFTVWTGLGVEGEPQMDV